jgi:DNA-binding MarR family transcriptional regulator
MTRAPDRFNAEALAKVDPVIHAPARLAIVTVLAVAGGADFVFLLKHTGLTRGNLSSHLTKLEAADYVSIEKRFVERVPRTMVKLTGEGSEALKTYRRQLTQALECLPE